MKQIEVNLLKSLGQGDESHRIPSTAHISSMPGGWGGGVYFSSFVNISLLGEKLKNLNTNWPMWVLNKITDKID